ncbi:hypothetical protein EPO14_03715 [Patescibacteria group bacterium]|nr:MAG: hypothetical protein EPO14_03715 [Patescibacteria group bacterium]
MNKEVRILRKMVPLEQVDVGLTEYRGQCADGGNHYWKATATVDVEGGGHAITNVCRHRKCKKLTYTPVS